MISKNILIIGGTGFIGSNLSIALSRNNTVYLLIRRTSSTINLPTDVVCVYFDDDILPAANRVAEKVDFDQLVYLASGLLPSSTCDQYLSEKSELYPQILRLLEFSSKRGIVFTYFSSGGTIYGNYSNSPYKETDRRLPISFYGLAKKEIEDLILFYNRNYGLKYLILRPSNPFGPGQKNVSSFGLIPSLLTCLRDNQTFNIWGNGDTIRDYIYIEGLVGVVKLLIENNTHNEIFNISSGNRLSIIGIVNTINSLTNKSLTLNYMPPRSFDVLFSALDNSKLLACTNYEFNDFTVDLKSYINFIGL